MAYGNKQLSSSQIAAYKSLEWNTIEEIILRWKYTFQTFNYFR